MNKNRIKSLIFGIETRIVAIISEGVVYRAGKQPIMKRVKAEIMRHAFLNDAEKNMLWLFAVEFYRECIASAARKKEPEDRSDRVYTVLRNLAPVLEKKKNEIADNVEGRLKHRELVSVLSSDNNFFVCSVLPDPAEGHAAYQGKIYFKGQGNYSEEEKKFILDHKLLSVEEVVLNDPWLCTRKNCRHRLIPISFNSAVSGNYNDIRDAKNISYAESQYRAYYDRLKMLRLLYKKIPSQKLKDDIKRTKILVDKWNTERKKK